MLLSPLEKNEAIKTSCNESSQELKKKEAEKLRKEFLEMVESKLKREEKDIWFVKNHEHLER